jgi:hypothetical protein
VLGLLIASAKSSYDRLSDDLTQISAKLILLDRVMAHYGPETKDARKLLRRSVVGALDQMWPEHSSRPVQLKPTAGSEALDDKIHALSPQNDAQRSRQAQALQLSTDLAQTRWLLVEQKGYDVQPAQLACVHQVDTAKRTGERYEDHSSSANDPGVHRCSHAGGCAGLRPADHRRAGVARRHRDD